MTTVDYWFDPVCPWSWVTSRWIREVVGPCGLDVNWHPMALGILNETPNANARMKNFFEILRGPVRVCAAVGETRPEELGNLYATIGENLHSSSGPLGQKKVAGEDMVTVVLRSRDEMIEASRAGLVDAGIDESFADRFRDPHVDDIILGSHARVPSGGHAQALIGVPTISIDGSAGLFGPVLTEVPPGPRAVSTWNAFAALANEPAFYELKRTAERPAPKTF